MSGTRDRWSAQAEGVLVSMNYRGATSQFFVKFNEDSLDGYPYEAGKLGEKYRVGRRVN